VKTNKDMHKKLIEVFSYRNDVSQRLAMVEEAFKLLLSRHRFFAPNYLVLRQQKIILGAIQSNPDYNVYRKQKDFNFWVQQLAEKQVKEMLLIDQLIYRENITVSNEDIVNYLNLDKRQRMREFMYFGLPESKHYGQEMPLAMNELSRVCAREKAINYVIYYLTKK
jgi:FKBP-type peptidyl-prolyl cis-trans isomerase (trigger factor)